MRAAFDDHKNHRTVYPYYVVTYWASGITGLRAATPNEAWTHVTLSNRDINASFSADEADIAYAVAQLLDLAYIAGKRDKAAEIRKVIGIKE